MACLNYFCLTIMMLGAASGFHNPCPNPHSSALDALFKKNKESPAPEPEPVELRKSEALPWAVRPAGLDAISLAGDRGFDPLNLAKNEKLLLEYREAEVKHARLAMLAAAGWPIAELFDGKLASKFGLPDLLVRPDADGIGLEPSILNGGLGAIPFAYWLGVIAFTSLIEVKLNSINDEYEKEGIVRQPGDFGFDPLGLFPLTEEARMEMYEKEIKHGRIAMVAITIFALEEFITKVPVVKETPFFFGL